MSKAFVIVGPRSIEEMEALLDSWAAELPADATTQQVMDHLEARARAVAERGPLPPPPKEQH